MEQQQNILLEKNTLHIEEKQSWYRGLIQVVKEEQLLSKEVTNAQIQ